MNTTQRKGTVPSTCSACFHAEVLAVDAAVREGLSLNEVARRFPPLHPKSLSRHVRNGHVAPDPDAPPSPGTPAAAERFDPIAALRRVASELEATDTSRLAPAAKIQHLDALRRVSADIARTLPPPEPTVVAMEEVQGLEDFLEVLMEVLEPHRAIREQLLERLRARDLMDVFG